MRNIYNFYYTKARCHHQNRSPRSHIRRLLIYVNARVLHAIRANSINFFTMPHNYVRPIKFLQKHLYFASKSH